MLLRVTVSFVSANARVPHGAARLQGSTSTPALSTNTTRLSGTHAASASIQIPDSCDVPHSESRKHPRQVCDWASQNGLSDWQLERSRHTTHLPLDVSQSGVAGVAAQSSLPWQALTHWPPA